MEGSGQIKKKKSIYHIRCPRFRLICYLFLLLYNHTEQQVRYFHYLSPKYMKHPLPGSPGLRSSLCATFKSTFLKDNSDHQFPAQKLWVNPYCLPNVVQTPNLKFNVLYNLVPSSVTDQSPTTSSQTPSTWATPGEVTFADHRHVLLSPLSFCASLLQWIWPPWRVCSFEFLPVKFYPEFKYSLIWSFTNVFWLLLSHILGIWASPPLKPQ